MRPGAHSSFIPSPTLHPSPQGGGRPCRQAFLASAIPAEAGIHAEPSTTGSALKGEHRRRTTIPARPCGNDEKRWHILTPSPLVGEGRDGG